MVVQPVPNETVDPRVRRTRLMLFEALKALLFEKDFERVSVQDIAERAALNRATFYDHYPDKFALLECMIAEQLNQLIRKRGLHFDGCDGALRKVALVVCDFWSELPCTNNKQRQLEMHVQAAMIAAVKTMIASGLRRHGGDDQAQTLTASAAAWAVCGAANEWIRTPNRCSTEMIATEIDRLVSPFFPDARSVLDRPSAVDTIDDKEALVRLTPRL